MKDVIPDHDAPPEMTRPAIVTRTDRAAIGSVTLKAAVRAVALSPGPKS